MHATSKRSQPLKAAAAVPLDVIKAAKVVIALSGWAKIPDGREIYQSSVVASFENSFILAKIFLASSEQLANLPLMTTKTSSENITRKFTVAYQLGSRGSTHNKLSAAIRAMLNARASARRSGDIQGITIEVTEYKDGKLWGTGELTEAESAEIELSELR
jgi:putative IMPACT (imprinted ancient) family translation regulator